MSKKQKIFDLYEKWAGEKVVKYEVLPPSGSYREYYRIEGKTKKAIAAYNHDKKENEAFLEFTKHFFKLGFNVPEIFIEDKEADIYLQEDLGDTTLFSVVSKELENNTFSDNLVDLYKKVLDELPKFQILGNDNLNFDLCYPRAKFDKQSMMWDLSYFKYYFLKLAKIHFDEQLLENDFHILSDYLLRANTDFFLYRDFQSRNIMIKDEKPYFIDYQGGRKGALQYDVASLLFDAKANIPMNIRKELLQYYIEVAGKLIRVDEEEFKGHYYGYVLIRIMQAMGAYGFRGFYEKKTHFLQSIPFAIKNLKWVLENVQFPIKIPTLLNVLDEITISEFLQKIGKPSTKSESDLTVEITSFSYRKGIPVDKSGNGGGFVFDCRAIHNPGKYDEYKDLTGKDKEIIEFLNNEVEANNFLESVFNIVDASVEKYISRDFSNLMVNFGCTGGQHRSVYSAESLAKHLKDKYKIKVSVNHIESKNWPKKTTQ